MIFKQFTDDLMRVAAKKNGTYDFSKHSIRKDVVGKRWEFTIEDKKVIVSSNVHPYVIIDGKVHRAHWPLAYEYKEGGIVLKMKNREDLVI